MTLPVSWQRMPIERILVPSSDGRLVGQGWSPQCEKEPANNEEEWACLKTTAIQPGSFQPQHNKRLPGGLTPRPHLQVEAGDLLLTCAGPRDRCGVACLVRNAAPRRMISGKMYRFRVHPAMDPRFVEYFLLSHEAWKAIDAMKTGVSDSGLNLTHGRFLQLEVPVAPAREQRRIVEAIESRFTCLDAAVMSLNRIRTKLTRYRTSVLKAACDGTLVKADPREWTSGNVGDYAETVQYGSSAKTTDEPDGVPVLRMGNLRDGRVVLDDLKFLPREHDEFPELFLQSGDLLFNRTNSPELVGKTAVFTGTPSPCSFASYLIRARFGPDLLPQFVSYWTNGPKGRAWVKSVVSQQVGQANVNGTKFKALEILIPSRKTQGEIVAEVERRLSVADSLSNEVENALSKCARLRRGILTEAFEGRLVPQDSRDEPVTLQGTTSVAVGRASRRKAA